MGSHPWNELGAWLWRAKTPGSHLTASTVAVFPEVVEVGTCAVVVTWDHLFDTQMKPCLWRFVPWSLATFDPAGGPRTRRPGSESPHSLVVRQTEDYQPRVYMMLARFLSMLLPWSSGHSCPSAKYLETSILKLGTRLVLMTQLLIQHVMCSR
mmetsp:Transcript_19815/g.53055  ORF Transcript_19815/g.53055 Transcript_19815/m.53055 type:complete len:153 (-) Transcript_19815:36-494(-)